MGDTARQLVALCDLFAERTGRSVSTVSRQATGSGDTIARLRRGRTITTRRAERALQFLSDHWPEPLEWPADIPRPVTSRADEGGPAPGGRPRS